MPIYHELGPQCLDCPAVAYARKTGKISKDTPLKRACEGPFVNMRFNFSWTKDSEKGQIFFGNNVDGGRRKISAPADCPAVHRK